MNCRTQTKAPHNGTQSSIDGAKAAEGSITWQKRKIITALECAKHDGLCDEEIAAATEIKLSTVNARRNELYKDKIVDKQGREVRTDSGVKVTIWVLAKYKADTLPF